MTVGVPLPPPQPHLVVVLGDVGGMDALRSLDLNELCTQRFQLKWHPWVAAEAEEIPRLAAMLVEAEPNVLCFGGDVPADLVLTLTRHVQVIAPATEIIMVSAAASPAAWTMAARAGVREVVAASAGIIDLSLAIDAAIERTARLRRHVARPEVAARRRGKVSVVLSPKGGSGKTMLAVNLAVALAQEAPQRVVLVDFDCQFGDVATALGLEPDRTLTELPSVPQLDASAVKLFLCHHEASSLFVLPSSVRPSDADLVDEDLASRVIDLLATEFDHVVVDTSAGIDERSVAAMSMASDLLLLASMDVSSVRNLVKELEVVDQLGLATARRHFVLNRFDARSGLRVGDIEDAVGLPVGYRVEASSAMLSAMNQGRPMTLTHRGGALVRPIEELARTLHGGDDATARAAKPSIFKRR